MQTQHETNCSNLTARIIVADDYAPWRAQVRNILQAMPEWQIVWEACDGSQAVLKAVELRPDLVLLDMAMPIMNGIEAAKEIRRKLPDCRILFVTNHNDSDMKTAALEIGAEGYVLKSQAGSDLLPSIVAALRPDTITNRNLRSVPYRRHIFSQHAQLSIRKCELRETAIEANHQLWKHPNDWLR